MKALIAEDDPYTKKALVEILQGEGFTVRSAGDGRSAVDIFREFRPGLVCLDVMMPVLSGYDACREIRKMDEDTAILFISAKSEEIDTVLGLELGADDFIIKPFGIRELTARVRSVLRRSAGRKNAPGENQPINLAGQNDFIFGSWVVKPRELRAYRAGEFPGPENPGNEQAAVDLSQREILMLLLLFRHRGEVVTREEFFRFCWNYESAPLSRTLDQHIASLRKKIERDPKNPGCIQTVQGAGYRYV